MDYAQGSAVVVIDADLQDPPELIIEMVKIWRDGFDVVYGKRTKRKGETVFKKFTAKVYYKLLKSMTNVDIPTDTGDFRLIDRKVCDAMKSLPERNRYVRGLVSWVGFRQTSLEYVRDERFAGETKYPLRKMIKLALDGITSFSYKPLKFAIGIGFIFAFASFVYLTVIIFQHIFTDTTVSGWSSYMVVQLFSTGVLLIMLGIIGEYIGRIFDEIKERPIYIVREVIGFGENTDKQEPPSKLQQ
jgi:dolichol-phosphate mannosyltransferase